MGCEKNLSGPEHGPLRAVLSDAVWKTVSYNLRFPGQYYQAETGLSQNMQRDYDPLTGRYVESDPIGLAGGTNTYAYVLNAPTQSTDRSGLLTINPSCNRFRRSIEAAERAITANLSKCWQCTRDGSTSCIDCKYRDSFAAYLANLGSVDCEPSLDVNGNCASGSVGAAGMTLTAILNPASRCARGGCIAETIVHELLHNIGLSHTTDQGVFDRERPKCTGALCGK